MLSRHSESVFNDRTVPLHIVAIELVGDFISLNSGNLLGILTSTPGTSQMLHDVQNVFEVPILSRKAWHTKLSSSHQLCSARRS